jgi:hypothetical protein
MARSTEGRIIISVGLHRRAAGNGTRRRTNCQDQDMQYPLTTLADQTIVFMSKRDRAMHGGSTVVTAGIR